jgi:hypothetical protein
MGSKKSTFSFSAVDIATQRLSFKISAFLSAVCGGTLPDEDAADFESFVDVVKLFRVQLPSIGHPIAEGRFEIKYCILL